MRLCGLVDDSGRGFDLARREVSGTSRWGAWHAACCVPGTDLRARRSSATRTWRWQLVVPPQYGRRLSIGLDDVDVPDRVDERVVIPGLSCHRLQRGWEVQPKHGRGCHAFGYDLLWLPTLKDARSPERGPRRFAERLRRCRILRP